MAFTVSDFHDLVRLLEEHPEWRASLRSLVLTEELLALPDLMRDLTARVDQLTAAHQRAEERQDQVEERLSRLEAAVVALAEAQRQFEARLTKVEERLTKVEERLEHVEERLERVETRLSGVETRLTTVEVKVDEMRGDLLELRYERRVGAYFGRQLRRAHVLTYEELDDLLDEGLERGVLNEDELQEVRQADLFIRGRQTSDRSELYLVIEVSATVALDDIERANRRAALFGRVRPALALVAGDRINDAAARLASAVSAWVLLGGRVFPPDDPDALLAAVQSGSDAENA